MKQTLTLRSILVVLSISLMSAATLALAQDDAAPAPTPSLSPKAHKKPKKKKKKKPAVQSQDQDIREDRVTGGPNTTGSTATAASTEAQNNRMKTLEGSKSRFSGQFNLSYSGSSLSHPFASTAPNPTGANPPPLVTLAGTASVRYRLDSQTTAGVGTGLTTQTPFQGPKNTTVADPYADIARSYKLGPVHNRLDFQGTLWTNDQYHNQDGYLWGLTLTNEAFYEFNFGLTAGFLIEVDYNGFSNSNQFASLDIGAQQVQWDLDTDPYFEYQLSKRVNLRTVIGIQSINYRNLSGDFVLTHPTVYETLGVGVQIFDAWFVYPFVEFTPSSVSSNSAIVGFNTIINLF